MICTPGPGRRCTIRGHAILWSRVLPGAGGPTSTRRRWLPAVMVIRHSRGATGGRIALSCLVCRSTVILPTPPTGEARAGSCHSVPPGIQAARIMRTRQPCGPMSRRFHSGGTGTTLGRLLKHGSNCCRVLKPPSPWERDRKGRGLSMDTLRRYVSTVWWLQGSPCSGSPALSS